MLNSIFLQSFRSYSKSEFKFGSGLTFIVGPNTSGKTNLIEAIFLLSTGKSFRAENYTQMISFGKDLARVKGMVGDIDLEVVITNEQKKYLVNGVSKRRADFAGHLPAVLFSPLDLDIIVDSPGLRRDFLDFVLEQVDREYRLSVVAYSKALRQRNALLETTQETGVRNEKQFEYWDQILIENGQVITQKRGEFIEFVNASSKDIFDFVMFYDKSIISTERLLQYREAEVSSGVTLVGPHRDDFSVSMFNPSTSSGQAATHDIKFFGSRGQQRLTILQLKLLQLAFIEKNLGERPILLLDDIFSELDEEHIKLVLEFMQGQQTIITTTHKEFVPKKLLDKADMIELKSK
ncbi:MAG: DNA replication and repair protein RecF [Candidatus Levybacteria bacterium]|nr:DNA replication and repair protein RecF [Candidatus Levybacteria bacterium]